MFATPSNSAKPSTQVSPLRSWPVFTGSPTQEQAGKPAAHNHAPEPIEPIKPPHVDGAQLQLLRAGDNATWAEFVAAWSPRLFSYLRYSLPTREDAEDVLSETMVVSVDAIKNFDGKSQLSTWLYAIARRKVADYWRKAGRDTEELSDLFQSAPTGFSLEFREALASMPENTRQALLLRYREGFSVSEVAQILGRSYKATESLLSRARALSAQQLKLEK